MPIKAVFLYPLRHDWRRQPGVPAPPVPDLAAGLHRDSWARPEFGSARL